MNILHTMLRLLRNKTFLLLLGLVLIYSCNVHLEKRKYTRGFYFYSDHQKNQNSAEAGATHSSVPAHPLTERHPLLQPVSNPDHQVIRKLSTQKNTKYESPADSHSSQDLENTGSIEKESNQKRVLAAASLNQNTSAVSSRNKEKNKNWNFLLLGGLMGLSVYGLLRLFKKSSLKFGRWARNHQKKSLAIVLTTGTALAATGFGLGKELYHSGWIFTESMQYVFGGAATLGSFGLLYRHRKRKVSETSFFKNKLFVLLFGTSFLMAGMGAGNQFSQGKKSQTVVAKNYERLAGENIQNTDPDLYSPSQSDGSRDGMIFGFVLLGILLFAVLAVAVCAIWCVALMSSAVLPLSILAVLVTAFCVFLFVQAVKGMNRKVNERYPQTP